MPHRFFANSPIQDDQILLEGKEAHHLLHVLRMTPGDSIILFDGRGAEYLARVDRCGRTDVTCTILKRNAVDRELPFQLTLAVTLPKGERQRWLVEKAVELGVRQLVPLVTQRSVARPTASAINRLQRAVIEASKQCGRNLLMEITAPQPWDHVVRVEDPQRLVAHPRSMRNDRAFAKNCGPALESASASQASTHIVRTQLRENSGPCQNMILAIGPEGGFTDEEIRLAKDAGWSVLDLGPRLLRIETAAIALISAIVIPCPVPH
ncbi:MAG: 16S rRNA (uracil(1498)-N(3))-methyltransferase [Pirellulales bacterium]|nr:16S rRNA (uracil(1498)-N(3))-methyltransferase [Pirellulales bacterium]